MVQLRVRHSKAHSGQPGVFELLCAAVQESGRCNIWVSGPSMQAHWLTKDRRPQHFKLVRWLAVQPQVSTRSAQGMLNYRPAQAESIEVRQGLFILAFPSYPPYFHLSYDIGILSNSISSARFSHLASCRSHLPHPPASGRHLQSRALCICHLIHLIYPIPSHLDAGQASRPSHLPSCHPKLEIEIWVFTSSQDRASPQEFIVIAQLLHALWGCLLSVTRPSSARRLHKAICRSSNG